jgi:hypothetical protein
LLSGSARKAAVSSNGSAEKKDAPKANGRSNKSAPAVELAPAKNGGRAPSSRRARVQA